MVNINGQVTSLKSFICVTAVWGYEYTHYFLSITLPSLLSEGNLPSLVSKRAYHIYTTKKDAEVIKQSYAFQTLQRIMPVQFHFITSLEGPFAFSTLSNCYRRAIYQADKQNAALFFFPANCVYADGSIANAETLMLEGARVISVPSVRLALEVVEPLFHEVFGEREGTVIKITARELVKIGLDNLHPITLKQVWNEGRYNDMIPDNLFWKIQDEGMVGRCFYLHPLAVFAQNKHAPFMAAIDQDYIINACPNTDEHYVVTDSDDICMFELTSLARTRKGIPNCTPNDLRLFTQTQMNHTHHANAKPYVYLHTGFQTEGLWSAAKNESDQMMHKILDIEYSQSTPTASVVMEAEQEVVEVA